VAISINEEGKSPWQQGAARCDARRT